jgi:hypothetical protein
MIMFSRISVLLPLLATLAASNLSAATGVIDIRVRDVQTHYAVRATISLEGPQSLSLETGDIGRVTRELLPGEYSVEVVAAGYKVHKTHFNIGPGESLSFHIMLDSDNPPDEERPDTVRARLRPGFTLLHGYVVDSESGKPISGVRVRFEKGGVETHTDLKGHYWLSVTTPGPAVTGAMGADTLTYEKTGYKTVIFDNFGISGEEMGGNGLELEMGSGIVRHDATHKLTRVGHGSGLAEETQTVTPAMSLSSELYGSVGGSGTPILVGTADRLTADRLAAAQAITVPGTILVGTGGSSTRSYQACSGAYTCSDVFSFSLENYISQGLPGEWYASWDVNAQMAGSVAYGSYGAYFVAHPACPSVGAHNGLVMGPARVFPGNGGNLKATSARRAGCGRFRRHPCGRDRPPRRAGLEISVRAYLTCGQAGRGAQIA